MTNKVEIAQLTQVVNNEQNFLRALNANLIRIQDAINDTLSRTGKSPNQMEEVLDMNGKRIANVGTPIADTDVPTKAYINGVVAEAQAALARIDSIVTDARNAVAQYAADYVYPVAQTALDGANAAKDTAVAAKNDAVSAKNDAVTAKTQAEKAAPWAEGSDAQVAALGGQHSSKVWAEQAAATVAGTKIYGGTVNASTATATLTSYAKARLGTSASTIVLTNDTTPVTGYAANSLIEYVVSDAGTFAGLTLAVNDTLWSNGSAWKIINNRDISVSDASEAVKGIAMLATSAEATAGTNDTKIMTPAKTAAAIAALTPSASSEVLADATPSLTASQQSELLSTGKWRPTESGEEPKPVSSGKRFIDASGVLSEYTAATSAYKQVPMYWYGDGYAAQLRRPVYCLGTYWIDTYSAQSNKILKEVNGSWETATLPFTATATTIELAGNDSVIIALDTDTGEYVYSTNGTNWTVGSETLGRTVNWCGDKFVTVGASATMKYSTDGVTWTSVTTNILPILPRQIVGKSGFYVLLDPLGSNTFVSADLVTWTAQSALLFFSAYMHPTLGCIASDENYLYTLASPSDSWVNTYNEIKYVSGYESTVYGVDCSSNIVKKSTNLTSWTSSGTITFTPGLIGGSSTKAIVAKGFAYGENSRTIFEDPFGSSAGSLTPLMLSKTDTETALAAKQGTLTASTGIAISNNVISATSMTGATSSTAGTAGMVPAPTTGDTSKFLKGDGTWGTAGNAPTYDETTQEITF